VTEWPSETFLTVPGPHVAEELAARVRAASGQPNDGVVGCDLHAICRVGRFVPRAAQFDPNQSHEALLIPSLAGGFEIFVDPRPGQKDAATTRRRMRFRIAHEIAHSFFYDRTSRVATRRATPGRPEEVFCDRFAAALLVPPKVVTSVPFAAENVRALSDALDVSAEVAGRALARANPVGAVVGLYLQAKPGTEEDVGWRVAWVEGKADGRFIPRYTRLRSRLVDLAGRNGAAHGTDDVAFGRDNGTFEVTALRAGSQLLVGLLPTTQQVRTDLVGALALPG